MQERYNLDRREWERNFMDDIFSSQLDNLVLMILNLNIDNCKAIYSSQIIVIEFWKQEWWEKMFGKDVEKKQNYILEI